MSSTILKSKIQVKLWYVSRVIIFFIPVIKKGEKREPEGRGQKWKFLLFIIYSIIYTTRGTVFDTFWVEKCSAKNKNLPKKCQK